MSEPHISTQNAWVEFPIFDAFYLVTPGAGEEHAWVLASLSSRRAAGAYAFRVRPGRSTDVEVTAHVFLREGVEDFEYFLLAGGGPLPKTPDIGNPVDTSVLSAVSSKTSYTRGVDYTLTLGGEYRF